MNRLELMNAVNLLSTSPHAQLLYGLLRAVIQAAVQRPLKTDDLQVGFLDAFVQLAVEDKGKYDAVIELVKRKRDELGLEPLEEPTPDKGFDKGEYQRDFMFEKRLRENFAADIENMIRPARDTLRGRTRMDFMQMQSRRWKEELDAALDTVRSHTPQGGRASKDDLNAVRNTFWRNIDIQLEQLHKLAHTEGSNPSYKRRKAK